jgi:Ubiquitin interaction motif
MGLSEEEALLQQALAMSMNENEPTQASTTEGGTEAIQLPAADSQMDDVDEDDAAMQMALQMSMQPDAEGTEEAKIDEVSVQESFMGCLLNHNRTHHRFFISSWLVPFLVWMLTIRPFNVL